MPQSAPNGKEWFFFFYATLHGRGVLSRVLDIGPGCGTYSDLLRTPFPGVHWTAVEVWGPYVERFGLAAKYDRIVVADARYVDWGLLGSFDLAVAGDVLEHMTKNEALALAGRLLEHCGLVAVSLPVRPYPQEPVHGNAFEAHVKDDWSHAEAVESFGPLLAGFYADGEIGVYLLAREVRLAKVAALAAQRAKERFLAAHGAGTPETGH